jgi:hypothetical protein
MVYKWPAHSLVFPEKSAVYDWGLHLLELGVVSLILSVSHFFVPNSVASNKNIRNTSLLEKKVSFHVFRARWMRSVLDIFVEWTQLCHNLAVHAKYIFIYEDMGLDKKRTMIVGKQVVPNSVDKLIFVPNSRSSNFLSLILSAAILSLILSTSHFLSLILSTSCLLSLILSVQQLFVPNSVGPATFRPQFCRSAIFCP